MTGIPIRFITENDPISAAIRLVTFSEWSHVEIGPVPSRDNPDRLVYIGAHAQGGIQERPVDYCKPSRERRYVISHNEAGVPCTEAQLAAVLASARKDIGVHYDLLNIGGLFLHNRGLHDASKEICSEWVFQKLWDGALIALNVLPGFSHLVTPEMLHLSTLLLRNCVYSK